MLLNIDEKKADAQVARYFGTQARCHYRHEFGAPLIIIKYMFQVQKGN